MRALGASADGRTLDTDIINAAIRHLSKNGGGTVLFSSGTYLTGSIHLLSNITLHLDAGATILGSTDINQYTRNAPPRPGSLEYARFAIINARGQSNIAITGQGTIIGQGAHPSFLRKHMDALGKINTYNNRPYGLSFVECRRVTVQGIRLENIAYWCQHYLDCDDVLVSGVTVDSKHGGGNNDGIDIEGSRNVRVSDSHFYSGDDAICLKAGYKDCENITITNCVASSDANGIKFGTASAAGFKNISISNCTVYDTGGSGLALETVDGGTIDNIAVSNITMRNVGTAIFIRLGDAARKWGGITPQPPGILRNVTISNITATVRPRPNDSRPFASSITGIPGRPVENINISNIQIITSCKVDPARARKIAATPVDNQPKKYPEASMFGSLPSSGLYIRHARDISLSNISFTSLTEDCRSVIVADDVENLRIDSFAATHTPNALPPIAFANIRRALLTRVYMPTLATPVLQLDTASTEILLDAHLAKNTPAILRADNATQDN